MAKDFFCIDRLLTFFIFHDIIKNEFELKNSKFIIKGNRRVG